MWCQVYQFLTTLLFFFLRCEHSSVPFNLYSITIPHIHQPPARALCQMLPSFLHHHHHHHHHHNLYLCTSSCHPTSVKLYPITNCKYHHHSANKHSCCITLKSAYEKDSQNNCPYVDPNTAQIFHRQRRKMVQPIWSIRKFFYFFIAETKALHNLPLVFSTTCFGHCFALKIWMI